MRNMTGLFIFGAGAVIGSFTAWCIAKKKYEKIAQEEIDSVKEVYSSRRQETVEDAVEKIEANRAESDICEEKTVTEYAAELQKNGYTDYSDADISNKVDEVEKPYVISPDEFGELYDYQKISLTFHSDHILAYEYEPIEDIEDLVGIESLNHFGEYEDDSVFVRNDRRKCDYEILLDQRKFSDVLKNRAN